MEKRGVGINPHSQQNIIQNENRSENGRNEDKDKNICQQIVGLNENLIQVMTHNMLS